MLMAIRNNYRSLLILVLICLPIFVLAQADTVGLPGGPAGPPSSLAPGLVPCGTKTNPTPCGYNNFLELVKRVFDYLVIFAVPLAAGVIAVGGAVMMTAGTNDSKRSQAKSIIWMAIWGLVIVLASYLIVRLVFTTLVEPDFTPSNFKN